MRLQPIFAVALLSLSLHAQQKALTSDPSPDKTNPASMQGIQIPSHGVLMNGFVYLAAGAGTHPTAILLHGLPGNERSLDIGQSMRRAGWNVVYFDYRGSWGTPGEFSFTHCIEDAEAAIAWLREPAVGQNMHVDTARLVLVGHSLGGFVANEAAAATPGLAGVITISAVDLNANRVVSVPAAQYATVAKTMAPRIAAQGLAPLTGCTGESLALDVLANAPKWVFPALAPQLAKVPYLIFTADDDWAPVNDALAAALKKAGDGHVATIHMATDHFYSDQRIALQTAILDWVGEL